MRIKIKNKKDADHVKLFLNSYNLERALVGNLKEVLNSGRNSQKSCRFCDKKEPDVSFKQETHVIPQLLHKSKPISRFECDACNENFSKYESDFGQFFLLERAFFGHKKKKGGFPKIKANDGYIQRDSEVQEFSEKHNIGPEILSKMENDELRLIKIQQDTAKENVRITDKSLILKFPRAPYIPLNVFRVFLKIGISLMSEEELSNFKIFSSFLNCTPPSIYSTAFKLYRYLIPTQKRIFFKSPVVILFNKIDLKSDYCSKILVMYFGNKIFQIPIFSDIDFKNAEKTERLNILKISPFINPFTIYDLPFEKGFLDLLSKIPVYEWNLYSQELVKGDVETIELSL